MKRRYSVFVVLVLFLSSCAMQTTSAPGTPPPPTTPPQVTVANSMVALSHVVGGATDALITCRQQSKCSADDVTAGENVISAIATAGKAIDAELVSTDPWATQQTKILAIVGQAGIAQLKAKVSPTGQLLIVSVITLFDNISQAVGGPTF